MVPTDYYIHYNAQAHSTNTSIMNPGSKVDVGLKAARQLAVQRLSQAKEMRLKNCV